MTHAFHPTWNSFNQEAGGTSSGNPPLPLPDVMRRLPTSGVLPSGEGAGFDFRQHTDVRAETSPSGDEPGITGVGINYPYPYPNASTPIEFAMVSGHYYASGTEYVKVLPQMFTEEWWEASGVVKTYPPSEGTLYNGGASIFAYSGGRSQFSNGVFVSGKQINDFKIWNDFVHHELVVGQQVKIPFLSSYTVSTGVWNPYG